MSRFSSRLPAFLNRESVIAERGQYSYTQRIIAIRGWMRCMNGVEESPGIIEVRQTVGALLQMESHSLLVGVGESLVQIRPQPPHDCFALAATAIHDRQLPSRRVFWRS